MTKKFVAFYAFTIFLHSCNKNETKADSFIIDENRSKAEWIGTASDHDRKGSFDVTGSLIAQADGKLKKGEVTIPIISIQNYDLPDHLKPVLLADLKDNFFKIALYPNAQFTLTKVSDYKGNDAGAIDGANYTLQGNFSMLGETHEVSFPARVQITSDSLLAESRFILDRSKWGMNNYSDMTQQLYIYPDVKMHLQIQARRIPAQ